MGLRCRAWKCNAWTRYNITLAEVNSSEKPTEDRINFSVHLLPNSNQLPKPAMVSRADSAGGEIQVSGNFIGDEELDGFCRCIFFRRKRLSGESGSLSTLMKKSPTGRNPHTHTGALSNAVGFVGEGLNSFDRRETSSSSQISSSEHDGLFFRAGSPGQVAHGFRSHSCRVAFDRVNPAGPVSFPKHKTDFAKKQTGMSFST